MTNYEVLPALTAKPANDSDLQITTGTITMSELAALLRISEGVLLQRISALCAKQTPTESE